MSWVESLVGWVGGWVVGWVGGWLGGRTFTHSAQHTVGAVREIQHRLRHKVDCTCAQLAACLLLWFGNSLRPWCHVHASYHTQPTATDAETLAVPSGADLAAVASSSSCPAVADLVFSRVGTTQQDLQNMMDMATGRQVRYRWSWGVVCWFLNVHQYATVACFLA